MGAFTCDNSNDYIVCIWYSFLIGKTQKWGKRKHSDSQRKKWQGKSFI